MNANETFGAMDFPDPVIFTGSKMDQITSSFLVMAAPFTCTE